MQANGVGRWSCWREDLLRQWPLVLLAGGDAVRPMAVGPAGAGDAVRPMAVGPAGVRRRY